MTAGRGIIHSEMPRQEDGLMWGFQLWVNLPADKKMSEPRYQELDPEEIPTVELEDGTRIRVIAGKSGGTLGAVTGIATDPLYIDVSMPAKSRFEQEVQPGHTLLAYVFDGEGDFGATDEESGKKLHQGRLAVFSDGDLVRVTTADSPVRFLLLAARPLGEPMARYGPFVMNDEAEIRQAFQDYREGKF
jgi:redox-sensitive bicupin YhaK (pirin superfamily)